MVQRVWTGRFVGDKQKNQKSTKDVVAAPSPRHPKNERLVGAQSNCTEEGSKRCRKESNRLRRRHHVRRCFHDVADGSRRSGRGRRASTTCASGGDGEGKVAWLRPRERRGSGGRLPHRWIRVRVLDDDDDGDGDDETDSSSFRRRRPGDGLLSIVVDSSLSAVRGRRRRGRRRRGR